MVFKVEGEFKESIDFIKSLHHREEWRITALVAPDCDALCSLHIIKASLFDKFMIPFKLVPVNGETSLENALENAARTAEGNNVFMLFNCGGSVDLVDVMEYAKFDDSNLFCVFDSARPIHLNNVNAENIWVFVDGTTKRKVEEKFPQTTTEDTSSDLAADDDDDELRNEPSRKKRRTNKQVKQAEEQYYSCNYWAKSTSCITFGIAREYYEHKSPHVLWWAAIGLTEQYLLQKINFHSYNNFRAELEGVATRLNQQHQQPRPAAEQQSSLALLAEAGDTSYERRGCVLITEDCRAPLLRHWCLFESMWHSQFFASAMDLYSTDQGKTKLDTLLSKVGVTALERYKQYVHLDGIVLSKFMNGVKTTYEDAIIRTFSFSLEYSSYGASDAVLAVNALLERPPPFGEIMANRNHDTTLQESQNDQQQQQLQDEIAGLTASCWKENFYLACNALSFKPNQMKAYKEGIELALDQQQCLVRLCETVLHNSYITIYTKYMRCRIPKETDKKDLMLIANPVVLKRMAVFLLDVFNRQGGAQRRRVNSNNKSSRNATRPLVVECFDHRRAEWLVVAAQPPTSSLKSEFGVWFESAAAGIKPSPCRFDGFDRTVVYVVENLMERFVESLHEVVDFSA
eukprot:TRINITY_DN56165_c0_g1_i1.p1 TRINITY_DN56165_c0_g1~~TRINITY_DN56165_c0_g1_i1.p1  ORF type:complete len:629 (+),score=45.31 TRINITY_DN56165_c0_g1_i1:35-1921(+)